MTYIQSPKIPALSSILPEEPILLMGAGPVPLPQAVAEANGKIINHLGDTMNTIISNVKLMGQYLFQTESKKILGIAGPSSAGMEMAISNLLWPGRKVLVIVMGTFSHRFAEMAEAVGAEVTILKAERPSVAEVERQLQQHKFDVITMVQGETSCGRLNVDLPEITQMAKRHGVLTIVDAICTLSTMPLNMDAWQIDVAIVGGQKGLSAIPGVCLIGFSEQAWQVIEKRTTVISHWCYNALLAQRFWSDRQYHYTAPVPGILALHEALRLICEEGLEQRFRRHTQCSQALQASLEAMGLTLYVPPEVRLQSVVAINIPKDIDGAAVRKVMLEQYAVDISGAFGLNILRIGQMGEQCRSHNMQRVLHALGEGMLAAGFPADLPAALSTLEQKLLS